MGSIVAAAWRVVLKRARADWLILSAALLTIVLATTLLSAGPIYAAAVTVSGLRRTLHDAPTQQADIQIYVDSNTNDYAARDQTVTRIATQSFAQIGSTIERSARSSSFALPNQPADNVTKLMVFSFFRNVQSHATLLTGSWPAAGSGQGNTVVAAIPEGTAKQLNLKVGDSLKVQNRLQGNLFITARVSGIYRINSVNDPYWWNDPLDTTGIEVGSSFTTYGPFVVDQQTFFGPLSTPGVRDTWRVYPDFPKIQVEMVSGLINNVDNLPNRLNAGLSANNQFYQQTGLDTMLRTAQRSLLVTRTGVLVVTVQLAILAGYALLLTANLLVDQRRVETGLLHSRGASTSQIVTMALMEALLLAIPAAIAGPWLAVLSLHILNHAGPLASIQLPVHPAVSRDAYALSALSALACVIALALPSLQAARSFVQARASRGRQLARGLAQRAGIDLILVVAAGLAYWQLRRYGAPITETVQGKLGLDPLLVAAPAIGLLAGAVVALRVIPLLARVVDLAASRIRPLVPALGAWQLARRPLAYARSALLLMLAIAIGIFALSYSSTWALSQQDQANYQVGADVRVQPDIRTGIAIPQYDLAQAQGQINGVRSTMPVLRDYLETSGNNTNGRILALDATQASGIVDFRGDLSSDPFPAMMRKLAAGRPKLATIPIPGKPQRLAFDVNLTLDPLPKGTPIPRGGADLSPMLSLTLADARGMLFNLPPLSFNDDDQMHRLIVPIAFSAPEGQVMTPQYPISIANVELDVHPIGGIPRSGRFDLQAIQTSPSLDGNDWAPAPLARNQVNWAVNQYGLSDQAQIKAAGSQPANGLSVQFTSPATRGFGYSALAFRLSENGPTLPQTLPGLVSDEFLSSTSTHVGDTIPLDLEGQRRDVKIVGAFSGFPTLDAGQPNVIVDYPTLAMLKFQTDAGTVDPSEWWLATAPGKRAAVVDTLQAAPYSSPSVMDRVDTGQSLRTDPVALGIIGALSLGYVAAGIFAALGFAVSAAVSSWSRLTEFALLRALGLSPGQLSSWLSLENGLLVVISLAGGTALGLLLAWLILPLVSLTQAASRTVPPVIVVIPWRNALILESAGLIVLILVIGVLASALRKIGLGSILRLGEE